jgi:hypothetical protein
MSGDPKNRVQAQWRRYFWMSLSPRAINPLIRRSQEAVERMPVAVEGGERREARGKVERIM